MTPPGPTPRAIETRYDDPLDLLWREAARRCGFPHIERSEEIFAAYDGEGTLTLGAPATLDADDCLAQLIFHELCHALAEAPAGLALPDWGLDNIGDGDLPREWVSLRVQAALSAPYGLRELLAPTTDHRAYYDALPADPLAPGDNDGDPNDAVDAEVIAAAQKALTLAREEPWASALGDALRRTADIATWASALAPEGSLWRRFHKPRPPDASRKPSSPSTPRT